MASIFLPGAPHSFPTFPLPLITPSRSASSVPPSTTSSARSTSTTSLTRTQVTNTSYPTQSANTNPWNNMGEITHRAIIVCAIIGLMIAFFICVFILLVRRRRAQAQLNGVEPGTLPLYTLHPRPNAVVPVGRGLGRAPGAPGTRVPGADAPPSYEEVVPPHLSLATGPPPVVLAPGPEDGVVADGKTPLSEIPFEDVMLEPSSSSSSSGSANQAFEAVHHNGIGDTRGHTNS